MIEKINELGPAFFDIFGSLAFLYVALVAIALLRRKRVNRFFALLLLFTGIAGLAVDLIFVSSTYL